jgi:two-component system nitrogen regulation response regulator NtrX
LPRSDIRNTLPLAGPGVRTVRAPDPPRRADAAPAAADRPALERQPYPIFAGSAAMAPVRQLLQAGGVGSTSILIAGEPGSGRQTLARALHAASRGPDRSFVVVDCSAMPPAALDVLLFGADRPVRDPREAQGLELVGRAGKVAEALGGTLLLKGLAMASPQVQTRLARVLRARMARDPRDRTPFAIDARVIGIVDVPRTSGSRGALARALDEQFALRIELPSLHKRREDIPALANWLLDNWCRSVSAPKKTLTPAAASLLASLRWRGNTPELRAFLEAVAPHVAAEITAEQLLAHIRLESGALAAYRLSLREARRRFEREYISAILEQHHGRVANAAEMLGIKRTNLYRKLRQLRVVRPGARTDTQNRGRA